MLYEVITDRAWAEIRGADRILMMVDSTRSDSSDPLTLWPELGENLHDLSHVTVIRNKADISGEPIRLEQVGEHTLIALSAKKGEGVDLLRQHLKQIMGFDASYNFV